ncbi:MAG: type II secretion system protein [Kiritimatiellae bacterium]|nr:type II secretion system protein [Kiritimatiellia bacterium]
MKKANKGFTLIELLVVIGILGLLMGVLVPQIVDAKFKSDMSACSMQGAKLVKAIIMQNSSRGSKSELWPHLTEDDGLTPTDSEDIAGTAFSTSTDYFKALFDITKQTSSDWSPYVDREIVSCLWGFGVPPAKPGDISKNNIAWTIAAGFPQGTEGTLPVLVTRNVDTSQFAMSGDVNMADKTTVPELNKYPQPFGKKGCVVVYLNGSGKTFPAKDARLCDIYSQQPNMSFAQGITLKYLEP